MDQDTRHSNAVLIREMTPPKFWCLARFVDERGQPTTNTGYL